MDPVQATMDTCIPALSASFMQTSQTASWDAWWIWQVVNSHLAVTVLPSWN
jgi:hypothetical protein